MTGKKASVILTLTAAVLIVLCACSANDEPLLSKTAEPGAAHMRITLAFEKQSGYASNQLAVWVEDTEGNLVQTLYATKFTAGGGYQSRPEAIPRWVQKSGLAGMNGEAVDAISGATPQSGSCSLLWDMKDQNGNDVPHGEYQFFVEGSLRGKNCVVYSGSITVGDSPAAKQADAEFFFEATEEQPALSEESPEASMIENVTAEYIPAAEQ